MKETKYLRRNRPDVLPVSSEARNSHCHFASAAKKEVTKALAVLKQNC